MTKILAILAVLCLVGSVEANPIRSRTVIRQRTVVRGGGARFSSFQSNVAVGGFSRSRFVSSSFVGGYGVQANFIQSAAYVQPAFVQSAVYVQPAVGCSTCGLGSVSGSAVRVRIR